MDKVEYTCEINQTGKTETFNISVPRGENLVNAGYEALGIKMSWRSGKYEKVPEFVVYNTYAITGIKTFVESPEKCEGCVMNCGGQKDHMSCPDGCLHDPGECDTCMTIT